METAERAVTRQKDVRGTKPGPLLRDLIWTGGMAGDVTYHQSSLKTLTRLAGAEVFDHPLKAFLKQPGHGPARALYRKLGARETGDRVVHEWHAAIDAATGDPPAPNCPEV